MSRMRLYNKMINSTNHLNQSHDLFANCSFKVSLNLIQVQTIKYLSILLTFIILHQTIIVALLPV